MNKIILTAFFFLCCFTSLRAQSKYLSENYWIENYTKKDGLPENIIIDIMQDAKGYMWITTPYNLVRFDGIQFTTFSTRKQLPDLYVHFFPGMAEGKDGILWIPTVNKGLFSFDPHTAKFRNFLNGTKADNVNDALINDMVADKSGNIWIGTASGLNLLTKNNDSISIHQFNMDYQHALCTFIDTYIANQQPIAAITRAGDNEKNTTEIEIKETSQFVVSCMGEGIDRLGDYGWIENEKGARIWAMDFSKCLSAGGDAKNKLQIEAITLTPGKYKISYVSDDSHSWNKWNATAPPRPDLWGIQLLKVPQQSIGKIEKQITEWLKNKPFFSVTAMKKDAAENLWVTDGSTLMKINTKASLQGRISSERIVLPSNFVPSSYLWILDNDRLLIMGQIYHPENKSTTIASVIYDDKKKTVSLTDQGLVMNSSDQSKALIRDRNKNYWMGSFNSTGDGLFISETNSDTPTFKKFRFNDSASKKTGLNDFEQIWKVYEDRSGYIWVGSRQTGLYKIKPRKTPLQYTDIRVPGNDKKPLSIAAIAEDVKADVWLTALDNGVFKYDRKNRQTIHYPETNKQSENPFFFNGPGNTLIIPGEHHTRQFTPGNPGLSPFPLHIPDSLYLVALDNNNNYWAMTKKLSSNPSQSFYVYNGKDFQQVSFDSTVFGVLRNVNICPNGNFWICASFEGAQLYRLNNQTKKLQFVKRYFPEEVDVNDLIEDENGIVWAGTYNEGLIRLDPKTNSTKYFTKAEGMPSNLITKMVLLKNRLWIITDLGTAFFNMSDETIRINKELDGYILKNIHGSFDYSFSDLGIKSSIFTTHAGEIALIAKNGFCILDPADLVLDTAKPILHITTLKIGGKNFDIDNLITGNELRYNQNNVEIGYIGLHYDDASKNKYSYDLKGANEQWVSAGTERIARYSNLSAGNYEFYLKACNADGIWSAEQKMFSFTILPPWWRTWWAYSLYLLVIGAMVWSYIAYRSRRLKQANVILEAKVEHRTQQLHHSLENLKSTQSQLIQSEKMASLGELTAGIAHEIQNPLNFVNNFSEVNTELIAEMVDEVKKGNTEEALSIANDIKDNEEKINHHGKRADAIVKGMLQHSRSSNGIKEPTDINALCDEYLRLSYHGLRAKDKSFNATLKTDFDQSIGKINIIPQDIGRVIMNLLTNAFYAVAEKKKQLQGPVIPEARTGTSLNEVYEPTVTVTTRRLSPPSGGWRAEITVTDNGNGIPQKVLEKIFQPFFTTKPTGQGTGLGLSLSYDIVTKGHGGELKVETNEGVGTTFIIQLPLV